MSRSRGRSDDGISLRLTERTLEEVGGTECSEEGWAEAMTGGGMRMAGNANGLG
jgi:hypothetical protein